MNLSETNKLLRRLFRQASDQQQSAPRPHVVDDPELLTCWSQGQLLPRDHEQFVDHLAECSFCCRDLADMVRSGVIALPEITKSSMEAPNVLPFRRRLQRRYLLAAGTLAAAVLLAVFIGLRLGFQPERELVRLDQEVQDGNFAKAVESLERLLGRDLSQPVRERTRKLLEKAGYFQARSWLSAGRFAEVVGLEKRLGERGIASARLENLKLQAGRRIPAEFALAQAGMLLHYGYELDGFAPAKGLPTIDNETEKQQRDWLKALSRFPGDALLRINFGQFLLTLGRYEEAQSQLAQAVKLGGQDSSANLGLGLVAYQSEDYPVALKHFQAALLVAPESLAAHLNAAMCYERLGKKASADYHWERAAGLTTDASLKQQIEAHRIVKS